MVRTWAAARARGESVAMMAPTNEAVASLNHRAQQLRARAGEIDLDGHGIHVGNHDIVVGDEVATRRNDRRLRSDRGRMVKNRDHWTVAAVHPDGALTLEGRTGEVRLPHDYVKDHVELAYAQTSHANQGRTVDRSLLLLQGPTDTAGIYVPMTRGRRSNEAFVVTDGEQSAADVVAESLARDWIDQPALARKAELQRDASLDRIPRQPSSPSPLGPVVLRQLFERGHALSRALTASAMDLQVASNHLRQAKGRRGELVRLIEEAHRRLERATATVDAYDRPLRRRRHRSELDSAQGTANAARRSMARDREELDHLEQKMPVLENKLARAQQAMGERPALERERDTVQHRLDADVSTRAGRLADQAPGYLIRHLGARPSHGYGANLWDEAGARVDQHRSAFGVNDDHDLLGRRPQWHDGAYAESHRVASGACERLQQTLGREVGIEGPGRDLGLSL